MGGAFHARAAVLRYRYVTGRQLWIVLEHMGGGSIEDIIKTTGPLHDEAIARILYCSVVGLGCEFQKSASFGVDAAIPEIADSIA